MNQQSVLNPTAMKAQCSGAITNMQQQNEDLTNVDTAMDKFIYDDEIKSISFDKLKIQIESYKLISEAMRCANDSDIADHGKVIDAMGADAEVLVGSEIIAGMEQALEDKKYYEQRAGECYSAAAQCIFSGYRSCLLMQAAAYQALAAHAQKTYEKWKAKEDRYDAIDNATCGLFSTGNSIRKTAAIGLTDIEGAFKRDAFYPDESAPWRKNIQEDILDGFINLGISEEKVNNLKKMGYTTDDILNSWGLCQTETDKEFFQYLMDGTEEGYAKAFAMNPENLSTSMAIVMEDYASHLLVLDEDGNSTKESEKKLSELNNALLKSGEHAFDELDGTSYRDVYLDYFRNASIASLEGYAITLASMDPKQEGYDELYREYEKVLAMSNFWTTEDILLDRLACYTIDPQNTQCSVLKLKFEDYRVQFDLNHYSPQYGKIVTEKIRTKLYLDGLAVYEKNNRIELETIRQEQEKSLENFIMQLGMDVSLTTLEYVAPMAAIPVSIALMAATNQADTVTGAESLGANEIQKTAIGYGNVLAEDTINAYIGYFNTVDELKGEEAQIFNEWFGTAGYYGVAVNEEGVLSGNNGYTFTGCYNPDTIRKMMIWEEQGMNGWIDWTDSKYKDADECLVAINKMEPFEYEYSTTFKEDSKALLKGKKDLFKDMSMGRFSEAVDIIDGIVIFKNTTTYEQFQGEWNEKE